MSADKNIGVKRRLTKGVRGMWKTPVALLGVSALLTFLLPSASSPNPNEQVVADYFRVGPKVSVRFARKPPYDPRREPGGDLFDRWPPGGRPDAQSRAQRRAR